MSFVFESWMKTGKTDWKVFLKFSHNIFSIERCIQINSKRDHHMSNHSASTVHFSDGHWRFGSRCRLYNVKLLPVKSLQNDYDILDIRLYPKDFEVFISGPYRRGARGRHFQEQNLNFFLRIIQIQKYFAWQNNLPTFHR